jgi:hypothetical protein
MLKSLFYWLVASRFNRLIIQILLIISLLSLLHELQQILNDMNNTAKDGFVLNDLIMWPNTVSRGFDIIFAF